MILRGDGAGDLSPFLRTDALADSTGDAARPLGPPEHDNRGCGGAAIGNTDGSGSPDCLVGARLPGLAESSPKRSPGGRKLGRCSTGGRCKLRVADPAGPGGPCWIFGSLTRAAVQMHTSTSTTMARMPRIAEIAPATLVPEPLRTASSIQLAMTPGIGNGSSLRSEGQALCGGDSWPACTEAPVGASEVRPGTPWGAAVLSLARPTSSETCRTDMKSRLSCGLQFPVPASSTLTEAATPATRQKETPSLSHLGHGRAGK